MTAEQRRLIEENVNLVYFCVGKMLEKKRLRPIADFRSEAFFGLTTAALYYDPDFRLNGKPVRFSTYACNVIFRRLYNKIRNDVRAAERLKTIQLYNTDPNDDLLTKLAVYDAETEEPDERLQRLPQIIAEAGLTERQLQVLQLIYWEGLTMKEIGRQLGVTGQRIRLIRIAAIEKLQRIAMPV